MKGRKLTRLIDDLRDDEVYKLIVAKITGQQLFLLRFAKMK